MSADRVTIVCVTYESKKLMPALARTLNQFAHVIVVDNASTDQTVACLRATAPNIEVIANAKNLGFGAGNNMALRKVQAEFALLLNPDCDIDEANLAILVAAADRFPRAGLVAPQSWKGSRPELSYNNSYFEPIARVPYLVPEGPACAKFLIACCLLVRVGAYEQNFFDERFFLYCEDDDLCLETYRRGYECMIEPAARAEHIGGSSSARSLRTEYLKGYHRAYSRRLLARKHVGAGADLALRLRHLALAPLALLAFSISFNGAKLAMWCGRIAQLARAAR